MSFFKSLDSVDVAWLFALLVRELVLVVTEGALFWLGLFEYIQDVGQTLQRLLSHGIGVIWEVMFSFGGFADNLVLFYVSLCFDWLMWLVYDAWIVGNEDAVADGGEQSRLVAPIQTLLILAFLINERRIIVKL